MDAPRTTDGWTARDREQIEQVFGLTGGELMNKSWIATDPDGREWTFHFWYESPPAYLEREFDYAHTYRTAVTNIMFGEPPERLAEWRRVGTYLTSGETQCPAHDCDLQGHDKPDHLVSEDECNGGPDCWLCEAKLGEEHGYIYIGDGWAEIVYQQDEEEKA